MNDFHNQIENILFEIGKDVQIHKLVDGNLILEIDYNKYVNKIINVCEQFYEK